MKRKAIITAIIGTVFIAITPCLGQRLVVLNFNNAPLSQILGFYADLIQQPITLTPATYPRITLKSDGRISEQETKSLILSCLASNGIALTESGDGITATLENITSGSSTNTTEYTTTRVIVPPRNTSGPVTTELSKPGNGHKVMGAEELRTRSQEYRQMLKQQGLPQPELTPKEIELGVKKE